MVFSLGIVPEIKQKVAQPGRIAPESFAFSVSTTAPVAALPNRLPSPDHPLNPLENKIFLVTLMVLKGNIPAFSLQNSEFSPKLEGRLIFPTKFNALN